MSVQVFQTPAAQVGPPRPAEATSPLSILSEEERLHIAAVHEFAEGEVAPRARAMEEEGRIPDDLIRRLAENGFLGVATPERFGGAGLDFFGVALTVETLARADASVALLVDVHNTMVAGALARFGTPEQQARLLPGLARSDIGAFSLSEPASGSDAFALRTRAKRVEGGFELTGTKAWVTNGAEASLFLVFARVGSKEESDGDGGSGVTAFLMRAGTPGLAVGNRERKLGLKASSTTEVFLQDCFVGDGDVLGEVGGGRRLALALLNEGRIGIAAQMVGVAQAALDHAVAYAKRRRAFGRPIGAYQSVAFALADAAAAVETSRLLTWNAARLVDGGNDTRFAASMAKLNAQRMAERVTSLAIEIHGGVGYTTDFPVERLWRDAKAGTIYEGTENMQLTSIAAGLRL